MKKKKDPLVEFYQKHYKGPVGFVSAEEWERLQNYQIGKRLESSYGNLAREWCDQYSFDCVSHALNEGYTEAQLEREFQHLEDREYNRREAIQDALMDHWW